MRWYFVLPIATASACAGAAAMLFWLDSHRHLGLLVYGEEAKSLAEEMVIRTAEPGEPPPPPSAAELRRGRELCDSLSRRTELPHWELAAASRLLGGERKLEVSRGELQQAWDRLGPVERSRALALGPSARQREDIEASLYEDKFVEEVRRRLTLALIPCGRFGAPPKQVPGYPNVVFPFRDRPIPGHS